MCCVGAQVMVKPFVIRPAVQAQYYEVGSKGTEGLPARDTEGLPASVYACAGCPSPRGGTWVRPSACTVT